MCRLLSGVWYRPDDQLYVSKRTESHEATIAEFELREVDAGGNVQLVRWELTPIDARARSVPTVEEIRKPLDQWRFIVDQDMVPDEFDVGKVEERARAALPLWYEQRVIDEGEHSVRDEIKYVIGGTVEAWDSATVRAGGSATVRAWDAATVQAWGSATVEAWGSATVRAWDAATVEAWDSASVRAGGSATVRAGGSATVEAGGSATVRAGDSATVRAWGSATVNHRASDAKPNIKDRAVWIDRSGNAPVIYTAQGRMIPCDD